MLAEFIEQLKSRLAEGLPGEAAQIKMAPLGRLNTQAYLNDSSIVPRISAVMVLFFQEEESIHTILIKRPDYDGVHSGQVAFPGGKFEEADITVEQTALREAWEETALDPHSVTVFGTLTPLYIPPSNFLVTPVLGYVTQLSQLVPDVREVKTILTPGLSQLFDDSILGSQNFKGSSGNWSINAPSYQLGEYAIWGATAMMISELKELCRSLQY